MTTFKQFNPDTATLAERWAFLAGFKVRCETCFGHGSTPSIPGEWYTCPTCQGTGERVLLEGLIKDCPDCEPSAEQHYGPLFLIPDLALLLTAMRQAGYKPSLDTSMDSFSWAFPKDSTVNPFDEFGVAIGGDRFRDDLDTAVTAACRALLAREGA